MSCGGGSGARGRAVGGKGNIIHSGGSTGRARRDVRTERGGRGGRGRAEHVRTRSRVAGLTPPTSGGPRPLLWRERRRDPASFLFLLDLTGFVQKKAAALVDGEGASTHGRLHPLVEGKGILLPISQGDQPETTVKSNSQYLERLEIARDIFNRDARSEQLPRPDSKMTVCF